MASENGHKLLGKAAYRKVFNPCQLENLHLTSSCPDYHDLTLDMNTANSYLSLSDGRRSVTTRAEPQPYPDHPDRFTRWAQVLCKAGMAGRCYWEVEWAGKGGVSIGVCYKNMSRSGDGSECKLGHNSRSWTLDCSSTACSFTHNKESVAVSAPCGRRIGVFLDFRGGALSFYNVSESMVLLHKEKVTLTQPVYPGFWVGGHLLITHSDVPSPSPPRDPKCLRCG
uniref:B30.2/SPRY domain-containing protein n=1 Tax=Oryzias latipes TaxID=8090 RepID=A0A3P9HBA1_ORYLA